MAAKIVVDDQFELDFQLLCCFCDDKFNNYNDLEKHLKSSKHNVTSETRGFPCRTNRCQKVYKNLKDFKTHVTSKHTLTKFLEVNKVEKVKNVSKKSWVPSQMRFDKMMAKSIANMRLNTTITGAGLGKIATEVGNMMRESMSDVQTKIRDYFEFYKVNTPNKDSFIDQFTCTESFSKYKEMRGQIDAL